MTVVLAGVGADSTNLGALGPLYDDGRFEYVPIPEKTCETAETETLGSWALRGDDGVAADITTRIEPQPVRGGRDPISGDDLESWPLHRDPNFEALTYGEHRTSGYVSRLRALEPGDVVGFYAGLRRPGGDRAHRYLIGYFTVDSVAVVTPEQSDEERRSILEAHPENAHAKRARGDELYLEKPVVIVDGREPGGLFDRDPIRISDYYVREGNVQAQYYLREEVESAWNVREGGANMMFKPAYRCELSGERFREKVGLPGERSSSDPPSRRSVPE
ncbi:Nmad3 family putative nucleotide modification protein [Natronococcus roseus]|uniref:Nmad3 family putative nucleotide modification protein n=1 Tax=Natronococcus roseus TaxID=1052014 RepID=UPI00374DE384